MENCKIRLHFQKKKIITKKSWISLKNLNHLYIIVYEKWKINLQQGNYIYNKEIQNTVNNFWCSCFTAIIFSINGANLNIFITIYPHFLSILE